MHTVGHGLSQRGKVRERNEDVWKGDDDLGVYLVCDGVGGHSGGDVAARIASNGILNVVKAERPLIERIRAGYDDPREALPMLVRAFRDAGDDVYESGRRTAGLDGMATTATLVLGLGPKIAMAHVGDSRLYLVRDDRAHQLTSDHTFLAELERKGLVAARTDANAHLGNTLSRALGRRPTVEVDTLLLDVAPGDRLVLCSDGLYRYFVRGDELSKCLTSDVEASAEALVAWAIEQGGRDNVTAGVIQIETGPEAPEIANALGTSAKIRLSALGAAKLFHDLSLAQVVHVLEIAQVREINAGETVVREGEAIDGMFIILDGRAELTQAHRTVRSAGFGDAIGEHALFGEQPSRVTLRCENRSHLLHIGRERFHDLVRKRPSLGVALLLRLAERLSERADPLL